MWLGTQSSRVARVRLPEKAEGSRIDLNEIEVTVFGKEDGLLEGVLKLFRVGNKVYIAGLGETVFSFEETTGRFSENPIFNGARSGHPLGNFRLREDNEGRVWIASTYGAPVIAHPQPDGSYTFEAIRQFRRKRIVDIYPEADGIVWFMGADELIRFDVKSGLGTETSRPPLIRQVLLGENDLLYGGADEPADTQIAHRSGAIRFSYAAPGELVQPEFRTQLEGFDADWSSWSKVSERSYTNIPPGDYRFRVQTEGISEAAFQFTVLPPWHRTWWAYGIYILMIGMTLEVGRRILKHRYQSRERKKFELKEAQSKMERLELQSALLESENNRMENELNIGHKIQMGMLITDFPKMKEIEVNAMLKPAREVGGDLYDVFFIDENHLCCCVGDVAGKGVPAALFMAISKTLLKAIAIHRHITIKESSIHKAKKNKFSTSAIMKIVNDELSHDNDEYMFVTAFLCIVNIKTGNTVYTSAGHNSPYILKNDDEIEIVNDKHGLALGAMEDVEYGESELELKPGEIFFLYTDGVTEAFNDSKELYTQERLEKLLVAYDIKSDENVVSVVINDVNEFEGDTEQTDDITALAIERL